MISFDPNQKGAPSSTEGVPARSGSRSGGRSDGAFARFLDADQKDAPPKSKSVAEAAVPSNDGDRKATATKESSDVPDGEPTRPKKKPKQKRNDESSDGASAQSQRPVVDPPVDADAADRGSIKAGRVDTRGEDAAIGEFPSTISSIPTTPGAVEELADPEEGDPVDALEEPGLETPDLDDSESVEQRQELERWSAVEDLPARGSSGGGFPGGSSESPNQVVEMLKADSETASDSGDFGYPAPPDSAGGADGTGPRHGSAGLVFTLDTGLPSSTASAASRVEYATTPLIEHVSETIAARVESLEDGDASQIRLKIEPEDLGRLEIQVRMDGNRLHGRIVASEAGTSELLARDRMVLLDSLKAIGLEFTSMDISYQQPDSGSAWRGDAQQPPFEWRTIRVAAEGSGGVPLATQGSEGRALDLIV